MQKMHAYKDVGGRAMQEQLPRSNFLLTHRAALLHPANVAFVRLTSMDAANAIVLLGTILALHGRCGSLQGFLPPRHLHIRDLRRCRSWASCPRDTCTSVCGGRSWASCPRDTCTSVCGGNAEIVRNKFLPCARGIPCIHAHKKTRVKNNAG